MARPRIEVSIENREKICYLYQKKQKTMEDIAALFPFSIAIVIRVLDEAGIKRLYTRQKKHPAWQHADEIASLYVNRTWSPRRLEKKYNCSRTLIEDILKSKGVTLRTRKNAQKLRQGKTQPARKTKAQLKKQLERLPDPLGRWLLRIHSEGASPNTRRFAERFLIPHHLVWDVSCKIRDILKGNYNET